jgi:hypothetical protein
MNDCSICGKSLKSGQVNKCQHCQEIGSKKRTTRKDYSAMASGRESGYAQGGGGYAQGGGGGGAKKQSQTGGGSDMDPENLSLGSLTGDFLAWAQAQKQAVKPKKQQDDKFKADISKLGLIQLRRGFNDLKYIPELQATIHFTPIKNPLRGIPNYSEEDPVYPLFDKRAKKKYICFFDGNVFDMRGNFIGNLNLQSLSK